MKVLCKHYDTCKDRIDCYHATPHEFTSGWNGLNSYYNCNEKWCHENECSAKYIRKMKLKKINESNLSIIS